MAQNCVTVTLCIESDSVDVCYCVNSSLWLIHTVSKIADKVDCGTAMSARGWHH